MHIKIFLKKFLTYHQNAKLTSLVCVDIITNESQLFTLKSFISKFFWYILYYILEIIRFQYFYRNIPDVF